mgnify:CR=1 FL=1
MDLFIDIAEAADEIGDSENADEDKRQTLKNAELMRLQDQNNTVNIAVAMDEAFCFIMKIT